VAGKVFHTREVAVRFLGAPMYNGVAGELAVPTGFWSSGGFHPRTVDPPQGHAKGSRLEFLNKVAIAYYHAIQPLFVADLVPTGFRDLPRTVPVIRQAAREWLQHDARAGFYVTPEVQPADAFSEAQFRMYLQRMRGKYDNPVG